MKFVGFFDVYDYYFNLKYGKKMWLFVVWKIFVDEVNDGK